MKVMLVVVVKLTKNNHFTGDEQSVVPIVNFIRSTRLVRTIANPVTTGYVFSKWQAGR